MSSDTLPPIKKEDLFHFPNIEIVKRDVQPITNLAPCVFNQTSREDAKDVIEVLRFTCQEVREERVFEKLGLREVNEYPTKVLPYEISFMGLNQILPIAVIDNRFERGQQVISAVGTIPLTPLSLGKWNLGHFQRFVEDGGGAHYRSFQNFMERKEENSASFKRFWLSPYIYKGIEFNPLKWFGEFSFNAAKLGKNGLVEYCDTATVNVSLAVTKNGLFLDEPFQAELARRYISSEEKLKFNIGKARGIDDHDRYDWPKLESGGENTTFDSSTLERMTGLCDYVSHKDLITASVFENAHSGKMRVDYRSSFRELITKFSQDKIDDLAGFNWIKFNN